MNNNIHMHIHTDIRITIGDEDVRVLAESGVHREKLDTLNLSGCISITARSLPPILEGFNGLAR